MSASRSWWFGVLLSLFCLPAEALGQAPCLPDVLLVFDMSNSMNLGVGGLQNGKPTRLEVLRQALAAVLPAYQNKLRFGLETFSTRRGPGNTCATQVPEVRIHVPVGPQSARRCVQTFHGVRADGCTPTYPALSKAREHFEREVIPKDGQKGRRRFVVLLTDGQPNTGCPGWRTPNDSQACSRYLVQEVQKLRGLQVAGQSHDIKTYVIGLGQTTASLNPQNLNDLAAAGGSGKYFHADSLDQLRKALDAIAQQLSAKARQCSLPSAEVAAENSPSDAGNPTHSTPDTGGAAAGPPRLPSDGGNRDQGIGSPSHSPPSAGCACSAHNTRGNIPLWFAMLLLALPWWRTLKR